MYYSNGFDSTYDELLTFYPGYYREIYEMQELLKAQGRAIDKGIEAIDRLIDNSFIMTADTKMIERLEQFIGLIPIANLSLDDRRKRVLAYFVGFGKVSGSSICNAIKALTGVNCSSEFNRKDQNDNYVLDIILQADGLTSTEFSIISDYLARRLPAHISYRIRRLRTHGEMLIYRHSQLSEFTHS